MQPVSVTIVGAGNVGYHLAWHLHNAGHRVEQVFSRHLPAARWVGTLLDIPYTNRLEDIKPDSDIFLISVKDDAIGEVVNRLRLPEKIVAHTSGTVPMDLLQPVSSHYGIFYPLQTLSRNISVDFSAIPFCINGSDDFTYEALRQLALSLTRKVVRIDDRQRLAIHVAAVFANNFTNHLFAIAQRILEHHDLSFEILKPLIGETVRKIQNHPPVNVQTGPAVRGDVQTIARHLEFLRDLDGFSDLYRQLTQSIEQLHQPAHAGR
ncbi:MAG: DUF2520 domain-containing protein [Chitinophagales bacterium]|nr:DUF2520 domain-containing protein [Chitinophagales bacterium]MDW8392737.1 DUF2520 domain-containing protein [Chitinophagales bacterium]